MTTQDQYAASVMNTFGTPRLVLSRGEGAYVWDEDGRRYLDLLGGIAVNVLGHGHPALVAAVTGQLQTLGHVSNFFATAPQVALAERLLALVGDGGPVPAPVDGRVFLTSSGTEANEAALKLTRRTGRTHLVAAEGSFHGRTMGALALTSKAAYREPFEPLPGQVTFVPYGDVAALEAAVTDRTAAVVLEPVQGEAGVVVAPEGYLREARRITSARGALLWLDEVQTGVGRTGTWFAFQDPATGLTGAGGPSGGLLPDVVTVAKGLAGGIPAGACIGVGDAGQLLQPGHHGSTFGGNPVAAAAALAVLDTLVEEGLLDHAAKLGERLRDGLAGDERVTDVRGRGLLIGLDLAQGPDHEPMAPAVTRAAQARGFIVNDCTPRRIRLAPPLVLTEEQVDDFLAAWPMILADAYDTRPDRRDGAHRQEKP